MEVMEKIKQHFVLDVPIFTRDILALAAGIPRSTAYYQIAKAVETGKLAKGGSRCLLLADANCAGRVRVAFSESAREEPHR